MSSKKRLKPKPTKPKTPKGVRQEVALKTSLRMGKRAMKTLDGLLIDAGVSRNSFFVLSILLAGVKLAGTLRARASVLDALEREFRREIIAARKDRED